MQNHATAVRFPAPATPKPAPAQTDRPVVLIDRWAAIVCPHIGPEGVRLMGFVHAGPDDVHGREIFTAQVVGFDPVAFVAETSDGCRYVLDRQRECGLPEDVALFFVRVDRP